MATKPAVLLCDSMSVCLNMQMPSVEMPAAFREFAEQSIAQARDGYSKMKVAAEEATDMVEDTYETAREGAFAIGVKTLDVAKAKANPFNAQVADNDWIFNAELGN